MFAVSHRELVPELHHRRERLGPRELSSRMNAIRGRDRDPRPTTLAVEPTLVGRVRRDPARGTRGSTTRRPGTGGRWRWHGAARGGWRRWRRRLRAWGGRRGRGRGRRGRGGGDGGGQRLLHPADGPVGGADGHPPLLTLEDLEGRAGRDRGPNLGIHIGAAEDAGLSRNRDLFDRLGLESMEGRRERHPHRQDGEDRDALHHGFSGKGGKTRPHLDAENDPPIGSWPVVHQDGGWGPSLSSSPVPRSSGTASPSSRRRRCRRSRSRRWRTPRRRARSALRSRRRRPRRRTPPRAGSRPR